MRWQEAAQDYVAAENLAQQTGKDGNEDLSAKIKFQLGVTYRRIEGKIEESITKLREAIAKDGGSKPNYLNNLGLSLFEADKM
jgi:tetratricopeptide (TPR) repeat protein